ncbi:transposase [Sorangium sp. So ce128]|uniref:transposase n=1 Tax=Sorangium sp. So ce128 TaxID=3133281 RepID=UPI003F612572
MRYCSRPAFALDRIELLPDGRIAYLLKTPRRGRTHRVMSPMEFMARLAALIPPPKIPLVRYHGVFAPRSSWRSLVTPKPPARSAKSEPCAGHAPLPAAPAPASPCAPPALSARSLAHAEPTVLPEMRTEDARAFHDHRLSGGAPHPRSSELALAAPNGSTPRARALWFPIRSIVQSSPTTSPLQASTHSGGGSKIMQDSYVHRSLLSSAVPGRSYDNHATIVS